MIPKAGKPPTKIDAYRPISLLSTFSKIFERILLARLMELPQVVNHIPRHQFGLRKSHGCPEQIHRLVNQVTHGFEHKLYTVGVFLDVKQAFDKVWHEGLLYKMKALLPAPYYAILRSAGPGHLCR